MNKLKYQLMVHIFKINDKLKRGLNLDAFIEINVILMNINN